MNHETTEPELQRKVVSLIAFLGGVLLLLPVTFQSNVWVHDHTPLLLMLGAVSFLTAIALLKKGVEAKRFLLYTIAIFAIMIGSIWIFI